jgi:hypothetical protein
VRGDGVRYGEGEVLVSSDVRGVPALRYCLIRIGFLGVGCTVGVCGMLSAALTEEDGPVQRTNLMRAVVLVVTLAVPALQASPDLSSHADSIAHLDRLDF